MTKPSTRHLACNASTGFEQGLNWVFGGTHFSTMTTHKGFDYKARELEGYAGR